MLVLHAHWLSPVRVGRSGEFLFWTEEAPDGRIRRPTGTATGPPKHPLARSAAYLRKHPELGHYFRDAKAGRITLVLPTVEGMPLPSPALDGAGTSDTPVPALWQVTGARLPAAEAALALISLPTTPGSIKGVVLGDDCMYWHLVAGLAIEAVAAQKLLPTIQREGDRAYWARWMPVLDAPKDDARVATLKLAMPPVCRAQPDEQGRHPSPESLFDSALAGMADALVRLWSPEIAESDTAQGYGHAWYASRYWYREEDNAVAAWADALFDPSGRLRRTRTDWEALRLKHEVWTRPLRVAAGSDFRPAFRLEAPQGTLEGVTAEDSEQQWHLHYALQARADPSLLIPASVVWDPSHSAAALGRDPRRAREVLLVALGCAARAFPPVEESLKSQRPESCTLDTAQAYAFLRETGPLLEQSGYAVLVPPWWTSARARLRRQLRLRSTTSEPPRDGAGSLNLDRLVSFKWQLALGDTALTREEFEALAAMKAPLVQIRGEWVHLDPEQVEDAIAFWQQEELEGQTSLLEAMRLGLAGRDPLDPLSVDEVTTEGWLADWLRRLSDQASLEALPQPDGLRGQLRPYQVYGYSWLAFLRRYGIGGILADDMGLGKTIQALSLLLREKEERGRLPGPTLLVAPTSVVTNWELEARRFAPALSTLVHQGAQRMRDAELVEAVRDVDLVLTSYALVRRDAKALRNIRWHGVILDEAQNIKNPASAQSRAVHTLSADFRFALTGTPVENRLSELWSIMSFLNPGHLGSLERFRRRFATPIERYGDDEAREDLRRLVGPLILRRVKSDPRVAPDLPEKVETKTYCHLTEEQATLYQAAVHNAMQQVEESEGIERRGLVLSMLMQLKQICNHPVQYLHQAESEDGLSSLRDRSGKLQRLAELLEEIAAVGERTLVFTQFAEMAGLLDRFIDHELGCTSLILTGATPASKRQALIERFQAEGKEPMVFVISLKAGGTGLNLTAANHVIHYDRWWNPAVEDQATDRAYRIGQRRNVQVHKFISVGTLEEAIDELIEGKRALAQSVVGTGEEWLTELSTEDLRHLVELRL